MNLFFRNVDVAVGCSSLTRKLQLWSGAVMASVMFVGCAFASESREKMACAVWERETAFSNSLDTHDKGTFQEFLSDSAVFGAASPREIRGKAKILADWADFLKGDEIRLIWRPQFVSIASSNDLAMSRGPYILAVTEKGKSPAFFIGNYVSVWRPEKNGTWSVVFDGGGPKPEKVSGEDVALKHLDSAPNRCPYSSDK